MSNAVSAHGTQVKRNGVLIAEVRDIELPPMTRETFDRTRIGQKDDHYHAGLRSFGLMSFEVNWLFNNATHAGLLTAWSAATEDIYDVIFSDGAAWQFNGFVAHIAPLAPVDGLQSARVIIRSTGGVSLLPLLLTEGGDFLITEGGDFVIVE